MRFGVRQWSGGRAVAAMHRNALLWVQQMCPFIVKAHRLQRDTDTSRGVCREVKNCWKGGDPPPPPPPSPPPCGLLTSAGKRQLV